MKLKQIKFDLQINGATVCNLDELRENFTTEILELHSSGKLLRWLKTREELVLESDRVSAITTENRAELWLFLLDIFGLTQTDLNLYEKIESDDVDAHVELARMPDLPSHLQQMLLKDDDESLRIALAENSNLSAKIQSELARKGSSNVQMALAGNTGLIDELQIHLIKYGGDNREDRPIHELNRILGENISICKEAQELLVDDSDHYVRRYLAKNPALAKNLYEKIKSNKYAIQDFAENPSLTEAEQTLLLAADENVRYSLATNTSLSKNVQNKLACDVLRVQKELASNPVLDKDVQAKLISADLEVQIRLAKNPSLAIEQQTYLLLNGNMDVRLSLFSNRVLDEGLKLQLVQMFSLSDYYLAAPDLSRQYENLKQLSFANKSCDYDDDNYRKRQSAQDEFSRIQDKCSAILNVLDARCDADEEFSKEYLKKILLLQLSFTIEMIRNNVALFSEVASQFQTLKLPELPH